MKGPDPILGALLIGFRGRADIGRLFAGYCLMLGRLWPVFNRFRGCHGSVALILVAFCVEGSVGVVTLLAVVGKHLAGPNRRHRGAVKPVACVVMMVDQD